MCSPFSGGAELHQLKNADCHDARIFLVLPACVNNKRVRVSVCVCMCVYKEESEMYGMFAQPDLINIPRARE